MLMIYVSILITVFQDDCLVFIHERNILFFFDKALYFYGHKYDPFFQPGLRTSCKFTSDESDR